MSWPLCLRGEKHADSLVSRMRSSASRRGHRLPEMRSCSAHEAVPEAKSPREKPPPPPELNGWLPDPIPPVFLEEMRRTFNEAEFLADVQEIERTGGVKFEDFIGEIEEMVNRRD